MAETNNLHEVIEGWKQSLSMILDSIEKCPLPMVEQQFDQITEMLPQMKQHIVDAKVACADPRERQVYESIKMLKEMKSRQEERNRHMEMMAQEEVRRERERMKMEQMARIQQEAMKMMAQAQLGGEQQYRQDCRCQDLAQMSAEQLTEKHSADLNTVAVAGAAKVDTCFCPCCGAVVPDGEMFCCECGQKI